MLILEDLSGEVPDTNAFHWNLKEHSNPNNKEAVLMYGYNSSANPNFHNIGREHERKIYFNNWAPCEFAQHEDHNGENAFTYDAYFNEVYSICPYTCEWMNKLEHSERIYKPIFYPFHEGLIPEEQEKKYDVIYHGGIHGEEHIGCLRTMLKFNYRYVTMTHSINELTRRCLQYATNGNLLFKEKINLIAQTKISVCYNMVHIAPTHIPAIKSYDRWSENEAFCEIDKWNIMPQFKTRMHEAAISKTLNLVQKDTWNVAEKFYTPDEDFLYFTDEQDLERKIREILSDWTSYQHIIDNAYNKSLNYTTDKFIERIKNDKTM